ncbi:hypothetical protein RUM43_009555 [Polyplax serrata]|uniref:Uncharacterized protein n=1 Tax=Polyplax serrata TaxID=468196 RepID=A0AAN8S2J4_POLSC
MFEEDSKRRKGNKQNVNDKAEEMKRCRRILKNGKAKKVFHCEKTARCPANEVKIKVAWRDPTKGPHVPLRSAVLKMPTLCLEWLGMVATLGTPPGTIETVKRSATKRTKCRG